MLRSNPQAQEICTRIFRADKPKQQRCSLTIVGQISCHTCTWQNSIDLWKWLNQNYKQHVSSYKVKWKGKSHTGKHIHIMWCDMILYTSKTKETKWYCVHICINTRRLWQIRIVYRAAGNSKITALLVSWKVPRCQLTDCRTKIPSLVDR